MINIFKVDEKEINEYRNIFKINNNSDIYLFRLDNKTIGYGLLDINNKENTIYISISNSHRGNGYGKELFKYILNEIKTIGIKKLELKIPKNNIYARNIISSIGGVHLSSTENNDLYSIPIK